MSKDKIRKIYKISGIIFAALLLVDGFGGVSMQKTGVDSVVALGYPTYFLLIIGSAKIAAAIAIIQNKYILVKEWAYAGFSFTCYGAFISRLFVSTTFINLISPIVLFLIMLVPYISWKKSL